MRTNQRVCKVDGCGGKVYSRMFCNTHYSADMLGQELTVVADAKLVCLGCGTIPDKPIADLRRTYARTKRIYCDAECKRVVHARQRTGECVDCGRRAQLTRGRCHWHHRRALETGELEYERGPYKKPYEGPHLTPAAVAMLVELADGRPRSEAILSDVTGYTRVTIHETYKRIRRDFGKDTVVSESAPYRRYRLLEPFALPSLGITPRV